MVFDDTCEAKVNLHDELLPLAQAYKPAFVPQPKPAEDEDEEGGSAWSFKRNSRDHRFGSRRKARSWTRPFPRFRREEENSPHAFTAAARSGIMGVTDVPRRPCPRGKVWTKEAYHEIRGGRQQLHRLL